MDGLIVVLRLPACNGACTANRRCCNPRHRTATVTVRERSSRRNTLALFHLRRPPRGLHATLGWRLMNILFVGDIFASPGRRIVADHLRDISETNRIDLAIANAENAAGGFGVTPPI